MSDDRIRPCWRAMEILKGVWIGFWAAAGWFLFATGEGLKTLGAFCFAFAGKESPNDN